MNRCPQNNIYYFGFVSLIIIIAIAEELLLPAHVRYYEKGASDYIDRHWRGHSVRHNSARNMHWDTIKGHPLWIHLYEWLPMCRPVGANGILANNGFRGDHRNAIRIRHRFHSHERM
jgi:hypothetical protein